MEPSECSTRSSLRIPLPTSTCLTQELELRLQCQNPTNRAVGSRGRPQNGALVHLRLRPPASVLSGPSPTRSEDGYCSSSSSSSSCKRYRFRLDCVDDISSSANDSETLVPPSIAEECPPQLIRRRRRVRGYCVNSDDEPESYSEDDDDDDDTKPLFGGPLFEDDGPESPPSPIKISFNPGEWIPASLLPRYTERIEVPPDPGLNFFERVVSSFTVYSEMKYARCDDDFDKIFTRLQLEWTYTAGLVSLQLSHNVYVLTRAACGPGSGRHGRVLHLPGFYIRYQPFRTGRGSGEQHRVRAWNRVCFVVPGPVCVGRPAHFCCQSTRS